MICFNNDYSEGAHPAILRALEEENLRQNPGYGADVHCAAAAARIRELAQCPDADVHFLVGGTPCNLISLTAFLRPHQAAIAAETGHIAVHESGSIEAAGHKVCTIAADQGKLTGELVRKVAAEHTDEHMVQPKLVFISDSTELGTIYTKAELTELRAVCDELGLYLYLDGARLASALTSEERFKMKMPLFHTEGVMPLEVLAGFPLILYRRWWQIVEDSFQRRGLSPRVQACGDSARTSLVLAQAGMGIALAPESMQAPAWDWGLEACPVDEPALFSGIALVQNENGCDTAAGQAFWDYFRSAAPEC